MSTGKPAAYIIDTVARAVLVPSVIGAVVHGLAAAQGWHPIQTDGTVNESERRDHRRDDMSQGTEPHPTNEHSDGQLPALDLRHVHERRALRVHAIVFALSIALIVQVNAALNAAAGITGEWWAWRSLLALVGWGLGLSVHGTVVRLSRG